MFFKLFYHYRLSKIKMQIKIAKQAKGFELKIVGKSSKVLFALKF
jgi:hypothetical protein